MGLVSSTADLALLVVVAEVAIAKLARFLSEFTVARGWLLVFLVWSGSFSRSDSSSVETDDVDVVLLEAVVTAAVVLLLLLAFSKLMMKSQIVNVFQRTISACNCF